MSLWCFFRTFGCGFWKPVNSIHMDPDFPRIIIQKSPCSFNWKPLGHLKVSANLVFQDSFSEFLGLKI